jgi:hypothetical protein
MVLSSWKRIVVPKSLRGLWLQNAFLFSKSLVPKNSYRIIQGIGIWEQFIKEKYFPQESIMD